MGDTLAARVTLAVITPSVNLMQSGNPSGSS
jgi:hypothetical protein